MGFVYGESWGTKPCVFSCEVALAGDERYLVCAAGVAASGCARSAANRFLLCVLQRGGGTQVMFLDGKSATHSHTARTHGRGWRAAHASFIDVKGLIAL